jgi:hypothetical protein
VSHLAVSTLGRLCLDRPDAAVPALLAAAEHPHLLDSVLAASINFGNGASCAAPLFARAYQSRKAKIRRLAVRAILSSRVSDPVSLGIVEQARSDPNGDVRKAAARGTA